MENLVENLLVLFIVGMAVFMIGRTFFRRSKKGPECGCGCSSCDTLTNCLEPEKKNRNRT